MNTLVDCHPTSSIIMTPTTTTTTTETPILSSSSLASSIHQQQHKSVGASSSSSSSVKDNDYNNDRILSKWGFTDNQCHKCGKLNSDLYGLLMQCAKCKKAYYCSMKCFNEHLPEHQKFCSTKEIYTEPKGRKNASPFEVIKEPPMIETFTDSNTKITFDTNRNVGYRVGGVPTEGTLEIENDDDNESVSEYESIINLIIHDDTTPRQEQHDDISEYTEVSYNHEVMIEESPDQNVMDLQSSMKSLALPDVMIDRTQRSIPNSQNMHNTFSDFGGTNYIRKLQRLDREPEDWKMEEVDLRHAEQIKNHYSWSTPDWVMDAKLRSTAHGTVLKNGTGDIVSPVTHAKVLIDKGIIAWKVPDWTNPKLRKTPRGEQIKQSTATTTTTKTTTTTTGS